MQANEVIQPCRALRNAAPQEWEAFTRMFSEYTAEVVDALTDADAAEIMTQKGRAVACKALLHTSCTLIPRPRQLLNRRLRPKAAADNVGEYHG